MSTNAGPPLRRGTASERGKAYPTTVRSASQNAVSPVTNDAGEGEELNIVSLRCPSSQKPTSDSCGDLAYHAPFSVKLNATSSNFTCEGLGSVGLVKAPGILVVEIQILTFSMDANEIQDEKEQKTELVQTGNS